MKRFLALAILPTLLASSALAGDDFMLDGSAGFVNVPATEVIQPGAASLGFGLQWGGAKDFFRLDPLPVGFSFGLARFWDMGVSLYLPVRPEEIAEKQYADMGARTRLRFMTQHWTRPSMSLEIRGSRLIREPEVTGAWVLGYRHKRLHVGLSIGGGVEKTVDGIAPLLVAGGGLEARLGKGAYLVAEVEYERRADWDTENPGRFGARFGARFVPGGPIGIRPFVGIESGRGMPVVRFGISAVLSTANLVTEDEDGDGIDDWTDECPSDGEDMDGWEDSDGCPDWDNDSDGIPDVRDDTPDGETTSTTDLSGHRARFLVLPPEVQELVMPPIGEILQRQQDWLKAHPLEGDAVPEPPPAEQPDESPSEDTAPE